MHKRFILFFLFIIVFNACERKSDVEEKVAEIKVDIPVERFDKLFFEADPAALPALRKRYPYFFPDPDDSVWLEKMKDPMWRELYGEVRAKFPDFSGPEKDIEELFRHIKYYFPETRMPKVVTLISEMDYNNKAIYADSLVLVSLELYLGKEHRFYQFPEYLRQNFEPSQIAPDIAEAFATRKVPPPNDKNLLSLMVYHGKILYLKELLLPASTDAARIGYTPEQVAWAAENESYIWQYFIQGQLLYNSDSRLPNRFIEPAPFSKFYLEIDNESPGRIGQWVGWQIVRSYMENSDTKLADMLAMDARALFEKSRYKPKKPQE